MNRFRIFGLLLCLFLMACQQENLVETATPYAEQPVAQVPTATTAVISTPIPATETAVPSQTPVAEIEEADVTETAVPPTAAPTIAPTNTPRAPYAEAPKCDDALHDQTQWHTLWNATHGCHYDHEHKHNPHEVDDIFGPPGVWFSGTEISYPWQTFVGANGRYPEWSGNDTELENSAKHENYGWIVRRNIPQHGDTWIRAFRLQYHAISAPPGTTTRFHSFSLEAEVCSDDDRCGIVRTGGWIDFGTLEVSNDVASLMSLPGEEDAMDDEGRRRLHYFYADLDRRREARFVSEFFWYGRVRPVEPPYKTPLSPLSIALATGDGWSNVDPADPHTQNFICPAFDCEKNGSTIQAHVVQFEVRESNFNGFTDRYGRLAENCTIITVDCIPLIIENAPLGRVNHRDDRDLDLPSRGSVDFDISPDGVWWIEYPN